MGERRKVALFVALAIGATGALLVVRGPAEAGQSGGQGDPSGTAGPGATATQSSTGSNRGAADGALVEGGRQLFLTSCVSCHGVDGFGGPDGPNIQTAGEAGADFMLRTGRMPMAAPSPQPPTKPPAYNDEQIRQLVAYVATLGNGPAIPEIDTSRGSVQKGSQLYLSNCAACHNSAAVGGAISYGRYAPSLQQTAAQQVGEAPRVGPGEMPTFDARAISPSELNDIATYVEYLRKPPNPGGANLGYTGPVAEGFVALLIGLGILVLVIRWITRESGAGSVKEAHGKVPVPAPHVKTARDAHPATTVGEAEANG
ncbi:MAG: c-type cytochrome [Actinobacteria bacterium]|nr:c-type cytochrome [Actinomycetota bacterium]